LGIEPLAEIVAHGMCAERFAYLHTVPALALDRALKKAGKDVFNLFFDGWYAELDKECRTATNELFFNGGNADAFCTRMQKKADSIKADSSVTKFKR
jgi:hypothetical protein